MLMKKIAFIMFTFFLLAVLTGTTTAQLDPEYAKALKYYNSGNFEEAVRLFKGYVEKKPEATAYYRIGYALYKLGRHDEAAKYFENAYLINPDFSPVLLEKQPVQQIKPEGPKVLGVAEEPEIAEVVPEEPVAKKEEIVLKEEPLKEAQPEVPQVPEPATEEPVVQKEDLATYAPKPGQKGDFVS